MNVEKEEWEQKLINLHTRTKGISSEHQIDYKSLLKKVFIGKSVLDVGCGTMWLKKHLLGKIYLGIDAYLPDFDGRLKVSVENIEVKEKFNTIFCFAALDGMRDLKLAIWSMKNLVTNNIVILTGINIDPDLYHTHLITEEFIASQMDGFKLTHRTQVHEKIVFLEYTKL